MNTLKLHLKTLLISTLILALPMGLNAHAESQPQGQQTRVEASTWLDSSLSTAFTYQGQLKQNGDPVDDTCDLRFILYDAQISGSQVGAIQEKTGVDVTNGLFTIPDLDFGEGVFTGEARWLEIAVRCPTGSGDYTTLSPRQALTAVPYAQFAPLAGSAPWGE